MWWNMRKFSENPAGQDAVSASPSRDAPDADNVMTYGKYMEQLSSKRRQPMYTISATPRFPGSRSSSMSRLGPGQYRIERDFASGDHEDVAASILTRSRSVTTYEFAREDKFAEDGALKGNSPFAGNAVPCPLGPGEYSIPKLGTPFFHYQAPSYSVPKAKWRKRE
mmetsp:Transcript_10765/g.20059  ORF Transcript_10765/g.20059 Transcript_10765/m.20059 type:complete len:166 (+) Transcript_10765:77-574(+)